MNSLFGFGVVFVERVDVVFVLIGFVLDFCFKLVIGSDFVLPELFLHVI